MSTTHQQHELMVTRDVACIQCGYNLRSLPTEGACPECGHDVSRTLAASLTCGDPHWIARVRRGVFCLALMLATVLCGFLLLFGVRELFGLGYGFREWAAAVHAGIVATFFALGVWFSTAVEPYSATTSVRYARWIARVSILTVSTLYFMNSFPPSGDLLIRWDVEGYVLPVLSGLSAVGYAAMGICFNAVAIRTRIQSALAPLAEMCYIVAGWCAAFLSLLFVARWLTEDMFYFLFAIWFISALLIYAGTLVSLAGFYSALNRALSTEQPS